MVEFVLLIWMYLPGGNIAPGLEAGTYFSLEQCEGARDSLKTEREDVSHVAYCVERLK